MLTVIDEYTQECLPIDVARQLTSGDVLERLSDLFSEGAVCPGHIRSDNGPEFTGEGGARWLGKDGVTTLYIEPGSPWENGYVEEASTASSATSCWMREIFDTLLEGEGADRAVGRVAAQHRCGAQLAGVSAAGAGGDRALDADPRGQASLTRAGDAGTGAVGVLT